MSTDAQAPEGMSPAPPEPELLRISEVARIVGRVPATIRLWCSRPELPSELRPQVINGIRYWTPAQAEGLAQWIAESGIYPGNNLPTYEPTPEQHRAHLEKMRAARTGQKEEAT